MQRLERIGAKIVASISEWFGDANNMAATAMLNASRIKQRMDVRGSDGRHVGTVLGVENDRIVVTSGGMDHTIDIAIVDAVKDGVVSLQTTAEETVRRWH